MSTAIVYFHASAGTVLETQVVQRKAQRITEDAPYVFQGRRYQIDVLLLFKNERSHNTLSHRALRAMQIICERKGIPCNVCPDDMAFLEKADQSGRKPARVYIALVEADETRTASPA